MFEETLAAAYAWIPRGQGRPLQQSRLQVMVAWSREEVVATEEIRDIFGDRIEKTQA